DFMFTLGIVPAFERPKDTSISTERRVKSSERDKVPLPDYILERMEPDKSGLRENSVTTTFRWMKAVKLYPNGRAILPFTEYEVVNIALANQPGPPVFTLDIRRVPGVEPETINILCAPPLGMR